MKKKIALALPSYLPAGQIWIYRQLALKEWSPTVILSNKIENLSQYPFEHEIILGKEEAYLYRGIKYKLWSIFQYRSPRLTKLSFNKFKTAIEGHKIGLVHAHFGTMGVNMLDICRRTDTKLITTFHAFDVTAVPLRWKAYKKKLKELFSYTSINIAISDYIKGKLIDLGCPEDKIIVSYLGIPVDKFPYVDRFTRLRNKLRFLHIGRITEKKGVPDLIRAFHKAFPTPMNVELIIIGDGEESNLCKHLIQDLAPKNPVVLQPAVPSKEVYDIMANADVFILNSRTDSSGNTEGLPIAILEAASSGLPIISTMHAGIPEAVLHEQSGFLIEEFDNSGLIQAMQNSLDSKLRKEQGKIARKLMEDKFDLGVCNKHLASIYAQTLRKI